MPVVSVSNANCGADGQVFGHLNQGRGRSHQTMEPVRQAPLHRRPRCSAPRPAGCPLRREPSGRRFLRRGGGLGVRRQSPASHRGQLLGQGSEGQLLEQCDDLLAVVLSRAARLKIQPDGHVGDDLPKFAAEFCVGPARLQRRLHPVRRHLVDVRVNGVERPVPLQQIRRALLADPLDAGDVVGLVAEQRLVVNQLRGFEPVLGLDRLRVCRGLCRRRSDRRSARGCGRPPPGGCRGHR